jgi:Mlc titration factor MtfA (ptsG expression regulator)
MPSRILSIPFVVAALVLLYLTWEVDEGYSTWIIPPVLMLALIYIFSPQINWRWYVRRPPALDAPIRRMLQQFHRFYQQLAPEAKQRFRDRVALFMIAHEYMPQGVESIPEDIKAAVAIHAVQLTFGQDDFLLEPFERIVIYPKPFPSPQHPRQFHASEVYEEDGVLLFAAEQLMLGTTAPEQYYNIGLHEWAKVYLHLHPDAAWPAVDADSWERLERISGMSREAIVKWINLPEEAIPALPVAISHFFVFPARFKEEWPDAYAAFGAVFQLDPAEMQMPAGR